MHELGYCEAVLEAVLRRARGRRVDAVGVRIGTDHAVVAEAFQLSFEVAALGTVAEGARTEVTAVPGDEVVLTWVGYVDTGSDLSGERVHEHSHRGA